MKDCALADLLALHVTIKPCSAYTSIEAKPLSRFDYATARAAGFDMSQFSIAPERYVRS